MPTHTIVVSGDDVALEVRITVDARQALTIDYRVRNTGTHPLAVFDRGTTGARTAPASPRTGSPSATAPPLSEASPDGHSFNHVALPLPKPTPTVPRVSLASRVDAGAVHEGRFVVRVDAGVPRVRYCLGTAPFDAGAFLPQDGAQPPAWRTPFAIAGTQHRLCTPWYSLADQRFEER